MGSAVKAAILCVILGLFGVPGSAGTAEEGTTPAASTSGIRAEVAPLVPPRDKTYGWWGVTRAGEAPDKRVH